MAAYFLTEKYKDAAELNQTLKDRLNSPPRRIDTITKLALVAGEKLKLQCTETINIILMSEKLSLSAMDQLISDIYHEKQQPMPMTFINSIGNAACFYLAQRVDNKSNCQFFALSESYPQLIKAYLSESENECFVFGFIFEEQLASSWLVVNSKSCSQTYGSLTFEHKKHELSMTAINKTLSGLATALNS